MKLWVGVTDNDWFNQLAAERPDEVNFWRPSGRAQFRAIEPGAPYLFKLHSPYNFIVGGGFFVRYTILPVSIAWEAFGRKNGVGSLEGLRGAINKYRRDTAVDPMIGCTILTEPFFLDEPNWVPIPGDWAPNIVQGKAYETQEELGAGIWEQVREAITHQPDARGARSPVGEGHDTDEQYGPAYLAHARLGQGTFRILVTDAYDRRCAVTGERTLPVLQAAHIKPFALSGPNRTENGLLLRSDLHILFDRGYVTLTKDYEVEVSRRIKEEYENGHDYYALSGTRLRTLPDQFMDRPSEEFIEWHNENVYLG